MATVVECKRGDTLSIIFRIRDSIGGVTPLDGVSFRMHVRDKAKNLVAELPGLGQGLELDEVEGTVTATVDASVTAEFKTQKHYTDLECTFPSGYVASSETVILKIDEDQTLPQET